MHSPTFICHFFTYKNMHIRNFFFCFSKWDWKKIFLTIACYRIIPFTNNNYFAYGNCIKLSHINYKVHASANRNTPRKTHLVWQLNELKWKYLEPACTRKSVFPSFLDIGWFKYESQCAWSSKSKAYVAISGLFFFWGNMNEMSLCWQKYESVWFWYSWNILQWFYLHRGYAEKENIGRK